MKSVHTVGVFGVHETRGRGGAKCLVRGRRVISNQWL